MYYYFLFVLLSLICGLNEVNSSYASPSEPELHNVSRRSNNGQCGRAWARIRSPNCSLSSQYIVNGVEASPMAWPWQLGIYNNMPWCGATLIHPNFAITAAHCLYDRDVSGDIIFGSFTQWSEINNSPNPRWWGSRYRNVIIHPNYDTVIHDNDIAIIQFAKQAPLIESLFPACLPDPGEEVQVGEDCYVTGWGETQNEAKNYYKQLQEICIPIQNSEQCAQNFATMGATFTRNMICAGYMEGGKDSCQGDSGGPLVCKRDGIWKLFGAVSWGLGCAQRGLPGVYTNVANYLDWIKYYVPV